MQGESRRPQPPELPEETRCFVVTRYTLEGTAAKRLSWLMDATDAYRNRCIGAQGLSALAGYLDALLIEQGYVTSRVSLGPQNLRQGEVRFTLHAGRIAAIELMNADKPQEPDSRWGTWKNAFPTGEGALLNSRDLEQGVEQMKRLPSQGVTTTLAPGPEPDTSVVSILRQAGSWRDRVRGGVTLDNSGGQTLGRTQISANVALENPLGLSDMLNLGLNSNAESPSPSRHSQGVNLGYSVPWGYSTFSASLSRSRYAQRIALTTTTLLSRGESRSAELRWQHTLLRTAASKTGLYAALISKRSQSYLDDVELVTAQRRTTTFDVGLNWQLIYGSGGSLDMEMGYRRGMPWLRAQDDLAQPPAAAEGQSTDLPPVPTLRPRIWILNVSTKLPLPAGSAQAGWPGQLQYGSSFRAQINRDYSTSMDQLAIGNRTSVRGFDGDAVLIAESGWVWRNELVAPIQAAGRELSAFAALDMGRVWGPSDLNLLGHRLVGAALGLRARLDDWQLELTLATPVNRPEGFKTAHASAYASATYSF